MTSEFVCLIVEGLLEENAGPLTRAVTIDEA
jgi:hypothetical protein